MSTATVERLSPTERLISSLKAAEELANAVFHTYDERGERLYGKGLELFALGALGRTATSVWESGDWDARDYVYNRAAVSDPALYDEAQRQASLQH